MALETDLQLGAQKAVQRWHYTNEAHIAAFATLYAERGDTTWESVSARAQKIGPMLKTGADSSLTVGVKIQDTSGAWEFLSQQVTVGVLLGFVGKAISANPATARVLGMIRASYEADVAALEELRVAYTGSGEASEGLARMLSTNRNALKLRYRAISPPDAVARFEARNTARYGNPLGPTIDDMRAAGKTWDQIARSATRTGGHDLGF